MSTRIFCCSTFRMSATAIWAAVMLCLTFAVGVSAASYTVTITSDGTNAVGSGGYAHGATVTITAGHHPKGLPFRMWSAQNESVVFEDAYSEKTTFTMPEGDVVLETVFGGLGKSLSNMATETVTDARDGKTYGVVRIGNRKWMSENLNYDTRGNIGSWCNGTNADSCAKYGRLYNWATAMDIDTFYNRNKKGNTGFTQRGICPEGWHLPNNAEWEALFDEAGGTDNAGIKLKAKDSWIGDLENTDDFGFSALPGGRKGTTAVTDVGFGTYGYWWTDEEFSTGTTATFVSMSNYSNVALINTNGSALKRLGQSIRCAAFIEQTYTVNVNSEGIGATGNGNYEPGAVMVTITAGIPLEGRKFKMWTTESYGVTFDDAYSATTTFIMPGNDVTVTATFGESHYTVAITGEGVDAVGGGRYADGEKVTITAGTAPEGKKFRKWTVQSEGVTLADLYSATTSFIMPEKDVMVTAEYGLAFTDSRDKQKYRMVEIGGKMWMAENLNYEILNDTGSRCASESQDDLVGTPDGCEKYGRLYNWPSAMAIDQSYIETKYEGSDFNHRGVCDIGWHLPDTAEWKSLIMDAGGSSIAGGKLKATDGWVGFSGDPYLNGTDDFGFSALPAGYDANDDFNHGLIRSVGTAASWWSSTAGELIKSTEAPFAEYYYIFNMEFNINGGNSASVGYMRTNVKRSVRCVADRLVVAKPTVTIPILVYTGSPQSPGIAQAPNGEYEVTGDEEENAGEYIATVTLDPGYMWSDGTTEDLKLDWAIKKAEGTFIDPVLYTTYFSGLTLADVPLPDGYAWSAALAPAAIHLSVGGQEFSATYTDPDSNHTAITGTITVNVTKGTGLEAIPPAALYIRSDSTSVKTFDLSAIHLNKEDCGGLRYSLGEIIDEGRILVHAPEITEGTTLLSYQGAGKTSGEATRVIIISSDNYEDISVVITFEATAQPIHAVAVTGGEAEKSAYPAGAKVVVTAYDALPGKVFEKWRTTDGVVFADSVAERTTFTMPDKPVAVTAVFKDVSYTITFITDGDPVSPASGVTVLGTGKLASLPAPTKTGYKFDAWFTEGVGGVRVDTGWAFSASAAIYARWTLGVYAVTWNSDGGAPVPTKKTVTYIDSISKPDSMTKAGHTFRGWYVDSAFATAAVFPIKNVASDTALYAKWVIATYGVTWYTNGGTPLLPMLSAVNHGDSVAAPPENVAKTGYALEGWCSDSALTAKVALPVSVTSDMKLYAKWVRVYTVTFNPNGGAVDTTSGVTDVNGWLKSLPTPTWVGHRFEGWYTSSSGGNKVTATTVFDGDATIFAHWTVALYLIGFDMRNGGTYIPPATTGPDGRLSSLPTPTGTEKQLFDGWYTEWNGGEKVTTSKVYTANAILYAHWITLYAVTFDPNGGTVSPTKEITGVDGKLTSLPTPTHAKTGYAFDGWYSSGGVKITTNYVFSADATVTAEWSPVSVSYTVTFNANGGTVSPASGKTLGNGTLASLPTPARTGYEFIGWYTTASSSVGVEVTTETVFEATANIYARWKPVYAITFNANGGTVSPASVKAEDDGTIASWPVPTRAGYEFGGWFTTSAATGGAEITPDHVFTANTTVYARWTLVTYTIIFDPNGGAVTVSSGVTGTGGRLASLPTLSSRSGYVFDGWFTEEVGGTKVTTSTAFTGDATVYAQWSPIYTITFDPAGGTVSTTTAKTAAGGKLASLPTPTRGTYTFVGWYTEEDGGVKVTASTVFDEDAVVYAQWSKLTHATVTFSAGVNGTLRATVDGLPIAPGDSVGIGKDVVFTAFPADGYKVARWTINGSAVIDTSYTYVIAGVSNAATISVSFEPRTSVASPDREIPSGTVGGEVAAIAPVKVLSGVLTVGPNPVRVGGDVAIYWTGGKSVSGSLSVFDAVGQKVARIDVRGTKKIGTWKVGDVAEGTYLIKGVLTDKNGVKVVVSALVGVVRF